MPKPHKPTETHAQTPEPVAPVSGPAVASRPARGARVQGPAPKFHEKKADARRKLPSGPIGGSGRKTNVSRSR